MAGCSAAQRRRRAAQTAPRRSRGAAAATTTGHLQSGRGPRLPASVWVRQQRRGDRDRDGRHVLHEAQQEEAKVCACELELSLACYQSLQDSEKAFSYDDPTPYWTASAEDGGKCALGVHF